MPRPIQITTVPIVFLGVLWETRMYALCDDGTIWYSDRISKKDASWKKCDEQIPLTKRGFIVN